MYRMMIRKRPLKSLSQKTKLTVQLSPQCLRLATKRLWKSLSMLPSLSSRGGNLPSRQRNIPIYDTDDRVTQTRSILVSSSQRHAELLVFHLSKSLSQEQKKNKNNPHLAFGGVITPSGFLLTMIFPAILPSIRDYLLVASSFLRTQNHTVRLAATHSHSHLQSWRFQSLNV